MAYEIIHGYVIMRKSRTIMRICSSLESGTAARSEHLGGGRGRRDGTYP